jgi:hypothetical protein
MTLTDVTNMILAKSTPAFQIVDRPVSSMQDSSLEDMEEPSAYREELSAHRDSGEPLHHDSGS